MLVHNYLHDQELCLVAAVMTLGIEAMRALLRTAAWDVRSVTATRNNQPMTILQHPCYGQNEYSTYGARPDSLGIFDRSIVRMRSALQV